MAKIGLSKPYYAIYSASGTNVSYSSGGVLGRAVNVDINIDSGSDNNFYADNVIAESDRTFGSGTMTLETDNLTQAVSKAIFGVQEGSVTGISGVTDSGAKELFFDDRQATPYLGIGFIVKSKVSGALSWRAIVFTKCMAAVTSESATTQGETITWQTPSLDITIMRDNSTYHAWKKEATFTTEAQAEAYIKARLNIT